ncbi:hypothetical protein E1211_23040 [Micromonospora sp. 15K316]|uniref:hypothetical protein n=1 Tax=Micromonospora sp. 15K316 TaxID=2530376 RepID=UPI001042F0CA|nr:hypothetical protein [Micromonospora sp. 15K316]TDC31107.1 hypothetical protein E1211_23040 [Micromonospora sp. 15K316]
MGVEIEVVQDLTDDLVQTLARLLPQLSRLSAPLDAESLARLVARPGNRLLVARVDGQIMGTLTLLRDSGVYRFDSGTQAD